MPIEILHRHTRKAVYCAEATDLRSAVVEAVVKSANLWGANLRGADLWGANLRGANLGGATINWTSHDLVADLLRRAAGDDVERRKVAGLVLLSRDWCWEDFGRLASDPLWDWALNTVAAYVRDGDGAPEILRERAALTADQAEAPHVDS